MTKQLGHGHTSFDYSALFGLKVKLTEAIPENPYRFNLSTLKEKTKLQKPDFGIAISWNR